MKEIDRLKGNPNALSAYRTGVSSLFNAGIIDALRALGRPLRRRNGEDHIQMASEASYSAGWCDCLETLLYFEETYLSQDNSNSQRPAMNFGSIERAIESGDLTKEEADAIKRGEPVNYDVKSFCNNIKHPSTTSFDAHPNARDKSNSRTDG